MTAVQWPTSTLSSLIPRLTGEDAQFAQAAHAPAIRSEQQVDNNGSHMWASGIGKANNESSSSKRRGDCEASEDKGVPQRRRIDPSSTQTRSPNAVSSNISSLEGVQMTIMEMNAPLK
ncbi:hypothetical protein PIB30_006471 [Stylosanthes scabra]|uniref:Uncharacterized protein n=1 Tax=Stylosanthes scabra TaxID=79078 RepID=A0ABU6V2I7_9FABA|nr:hypothetical protein [Stylosanthes scabra]